MNPMTEEVFAKIFEAHYGRKVGEPAPLVEYNQGDPNCAHERIVYLNVAFDGQAWWCDNPSCKKHEGVEYSPGYIMPLPKNALVALPNPKYGGVDNNGREKFYSHKTDDNGLAKLLDRKDWVERVK